MCSTYLISPEKGTSQRARANKIAAAVEKLPSMWVRKSGPGIVMLADERVEIMRWGGGRHFNPAKGAA